MKYREWFDIWLESYVKPTAKPRTYERYVHLREVIVLGFGELNMSEITPYDLQIFATRLTELEKPKGGTYAVSTQNLAISVLTSSLKAAASFGYIELRRYDFIRRPKLTERTAPCFSRREQYKMEHFIEKNLNPKTFGFLLCLYSGLRLGELLALEWSDICLREGVIRVTKSVHVATDEKGVRRRIVGTPKTNSSARIVPLPKKLIALLRTIKKMGNSTYVVSNNSQPIEPRSYQRSFKQFLEVVGIKYKSFHTLRHTYATRALECGMDIKTLSEIMGHKNCSITLDRYTHSLMEHKRKSVQKLDSLFDVHPFRLV